MPITNPFQNDTYRIGWKPLTLALLCAAALSLSACATPKNNPNSPVSYTHLTLPTTPYV